MQRDSSGQYWPAPGRQVGNGADGAGFFQYSRNATLNQPMMTDINGNQNTVSQLIVHMNGGTFNAPTNTSMMMSDGNSGAALLMGMQTGNHRSIHHSPDRAAPEVPLPSQQDVFQQSYPELQRLMSNGISSNAPSIISAVLDALESEKTTTMDYFRQARVDGLIKALATVPSQPKDKRSHSTRRVRELVGLSSSVGTGLLNPILSNIGPTPFYGHFKPIHCVTFSSNGALLASSSGSLMGRKDCTIRIWDAQTGDCVVGPLTGHTERVNSVAFSPDTSRLVSGSDDSTLRLWEFPQGDEVMAPVKENSRILTVAFSPDGKSFATGSAHCQIRIRNASTGRPIFDAFSLYYTPKSVVYSPDGQRLAASSNNEIRIWNARTGAKIIDEVSGYPRCISALAFSPDGRRIASGVSYAVWAWDANTGQELMRSESEHKKCVVCVAYSPDGRRLVSGAEDKAIRIWDARSGRLVAGPLKGHTDTVNTVAVSPDGTRIVSGSEDGTIRVWDMKTGSLMVSSC
ncbi:hypothetical protein HGRIS_005989 [Hohenbuehelia grisea]|uniref:WD40 repeat-like protein n=1 Tax=Hohenbuehelia grisea TaxID=104357 RepID=A0ABR3JYK6_9AGAR